MAASAITVAPEKREKTPPPPVNREKTCPFLLRVFCNTGRPYPLSDFARGNTPPNELQIYTWPDATLKELTSLIKEVNLDARRKYAIIEFHIVFPHTQMARYMSRELGTICVGRKGQDDLVTLKEKRFMIGDYLNVSIQPPGRDRGPIRMRPY